VTPPPSAEKPAAEKAESPQEGRKAVQKSSWLWMVVAGVVLVAGTGAGIYAHRVNGRMVILQRQLAQTRATVQAALEKVSALKIPKDLSTDVANLEVTAAKLRAADEALRRSFNDEMQKIPALEARLSDAHSALKGRLANAEQEFKAFQDKNEGRMTNIIAVIKNQDKVLRRLAEESATPQNEE
jgi:hypothetical protein